MHQLTIYGASDDLIEVEGDISEEFNHLDEAPAVLSISDGTTLEVVYDKEGMWRITPRRTGEGTTVAIVTADDPDENYSDRVTMTSEKPFDWVAFGKQKSKRKAGR